LLKIAPDLTDSQLDDIVEITISSGIAGVVATNTTISREGLKTVRTLVENIGAGGLSGAPVRKRSTQVVEYLHKKSNGAFPIIGVGGILSGADAVAKVKAGADVVQIYTGLIYRGPALITEVAQALQSSRR
jgi:dihydroorotate dehydrogenase